MWRTVCDSKYDLSVTKCFGFCVQEPGGSCPSGHSFRGFLQYYGCIWFMSLSLYYGFRIHGLTIPVGFLSVGWKRIVPIHLKRFPLLRILFLVSCLSLAETTLTFFRPVNRVGSGFWLYYTSGVFMFMLKFFHIKTPRSPSFLLRLLYLGLISCR